MAQAAKQTYEGMHRLIPKLRPIALEQLGLEGAINDLISELKKIHPTIQFNTTIAISKKDDSIEIALFRIIQEALNNAIKHAHPNQVELTLIENKNAISLTIENDGQKPDNLNKPGRYGIIGIQERVDYLHGTIQFQPLDHGLRIQIQINHE